MNSFKIDQKSRLDQANAKISQLTNDMDTMKSKIESILYHPGDSGIVAQNNQPVYFNFGLKSHIRSGTGIIKFDADRGSRLWFGLYLGNRKIRNQVKYRNSWKIGFERTHLANAKFNGQ